MGTKAVFAVRSQVRPSPRFWTTIIGMTSDGFPSNLEYIADCFQKKMKELRLKTKVKRRDWKATKKVMEAIVADHADWLFIDELRNAQWVSYSLVLDPKTNGREHRIGKP